MSNKRIVSVRNKGYLLWLPIIFLSLLSLIFPNNSNAQSNEKLVKSSISGTVIDARENIFLQNSTAALIRKTDSILVQAVRTDASGKFLIDGLNPGNYTLLISYPRMADFLKNIQIGNNDSVALGSISMESETFLLNEVIIMAGKSARRMKGDTVVFQADSFSVRANANIQELLKRLPGIEINKDGAIQANGKSVNTVLVDGEEFFGDDPLLVTKYLKANVVAEVQVYDKKSKQTDLSGIEDGKQDKVINIKLKDQSKNGYLSSLEANSDFTKYRNLGGMAGIYKGKMKLALFGNSNNLNQRSKIMSELRSNNYEVIEMGENGEDIVSSIGKNDYLSSSSGLPSTTNYGAHFSNKLNDGKLALKLNYNNTQNMILGIQRINSQRLLQDGSSFYNTNLGDNSSNKKEQSFNGVFKILLDSLSAVEVSFSGHKNLGEKNLIESEISMNEKGILVSQNSQRNNTKGDGEIFRGNISYSRKSTKKNRTFSIEIQPEVQNSSSVQIAYSNATYNNVNGGNNNSEILELLKENSNKQNSLAGRISYTEPLVKNLSLQASYSFKMFSSNSGRVVYDQLANKALIDSLTNHFNFNNLSNGGKLMIQYQYKRVSIVGGVEATKTNFNLKDIDRGIVLNRGYLNWAPRGSIKYRLNNFITANIVYVGETRQPEIAQLQPLRQIDNPLYQIVGNPNLKPSFVNKLSSEIFFDKSDMQIFGFLNYDFAKNAVASAEYIDQFNKRTLSFINLDGIHSLSSGIYFKKNLQTKLTAGFKIEYAKTQSVGFLNGERSTNASRSILLKPNFSYYGDRINFSYYASLDFMNSFSSVGAVTKRKTFVHSHEFDGSLNLPFKTELKSSLSLTFRPANTSFSQSINVALWNASLTKRVLKSENLEISLSVKDILKQNKGYSRHVFGNYLSESNINFIPRYVMFGIAYNVTGNFTKSNN